MVEKLTAADRGNARRCAERFAHGMFHGPGTSQWVRRDGTIHMTEEMLVHLLAEVHTTAYQGGCQDTYEAILSGLRARGDNAGKVLADALESARRSSNGA